jgi:TolB-like protein/DNA-binding winged helix-turn-helix (wHTH) protein/Tfp pilus assembly protein PilF
MPTDVVKLGPDLELDRVAYELRRSGRALKLERIPMEILFLLIERKGQLVSREDIIARIWGKDVFLDTDNSINSAIRKIRQVLKDDPENPTFIQTVTGKGYRFIAPVPVPVAAAVNEVAIPDRDPGALNPVVKVQAVEAGFVPSLPSGRYRWLQWIVPGVALAMLLATGTYLLHRRTRSPSAATPHRAMLAVLPFANLSSDPEQEYFSDGLTEETITDLGEINPDQLGVIARTSSTSYKHTTKTIAQIGKELGVDYILEGSVRREGGVARVSAQLIQVKDQVHLWAHNYDREPGGLLALQDELGRAIAQQVQVKLAPSYGNRSINKYAANPEAYELYLEGRYYRNKQTFPEIEKSTEYFQKSIEKDPGFALAYAGLADSYLANSITSPRDFDPKAKAAASRALELDDGLAEAHAALGAVYADFEYDWPAAERELKRAIELNPNYADGHFRYAWSYLTPLGKSDQAIAEMKRALELDPFSRMDNTVLGCIYFYGRRNGQALEQFEKAIKLNPDFFVTYYHLAWLYSAFGRYPDAISALTKGRLASGDQRVKDALFYEVALRKAFAAEGAKGFWQQIETGQDSPIGEFGKAQAYARLGEGEKALQELQRNYEERSPLATLVNVDPAFDSLRSDPRFKELVRRMGMTPNAKDQ